MDQIMSVYDMLNQDAEFARQVIEIRQSADSLEKTAEEQSALYDKINARIEELDSLV